MIGYRTPCLVLLSEGREDLVFPLVGDRVTIGRALDSDIQFDAEHVSRRHAEVFRQDDAWFVRDGGSRNGTRVNGARVVAEHRLAPNDRIDLGRRAVTLYFVEVNPASLDEAPAAA